MKKPWASFIQKTYRKNILLNKNWPSEPDNGWYNPDTWFEKITDIARTTVVVGYIDGVPMVMDDLKKVAEENALSNQGEFISRQDGYYSAHFVCVSECNLPTIDWGVVTKNVSLEIQVTTKMKEVIKSLLHGFYEEKRNVDGSMQMGSGISWNYKSDEFIASYLGHILHYVEGMIIDVRDRKGK